MSRRAHLRLRLGAFALLAAMAVLPRTRAAGEAQATSQAPRARTATHVETTAARLAGAPRTTKLVVAAADPSRSTD